MGVPFIHSPGHARTREPLEGFGKDPTTFGHCSSRQPHHSLRLGYTGEPYHSTNNTGLIATLTKLSLSRSRSTGHHRLLPSPTMVEEMHHRHQIQAQCSTSTGTRSLRQFFITVYTTATEWDTWMRFASKVYSGYTLVVRVDLDIGLG